MNDEANLHHPTLTRRRFIAETSALVGATNLLLPWLRATETGPVTAKPTCVTCGTQYPVGPNPSVCPICEDSRQYVGRDGQQWTSSEEIARSHRTEFRQQEVNLWGIGLEPAFALGQRALLVQSPRGNVLWDCLPLVDDHAAARVRQLGGLAAIAISHPHYYGAMVDWSHAFGGVPVYLHADNRSWVMRPDPVIRFWEGETCVLETGATLARTGGHFPGSQVMLWPEGADGRGALLSGDEPHVSADRRWVSFMHSFPNHIPLNADAIRRIAYALSPLSYDRLYGAWWHSLVASGAKDAVARSVDRYLRAIGV